MTISISELEAIERAMTDAPRQQSGKSEYIVYATSHAIVDTTSVDDAAGIVAARNALPELLAIAKAALAWSAVQSDEAHYKDKDAACQRLFDVVRATVRP